MTVILLLKAHVRGYTRKDGTLGGPLVKAIEAGERWITVHPNGPDEKGQPILIQPQPDGSAKVVGGAGGSLNHLRLTGVKKQGDYANTIRERAKTRREAAKTRVEQDKKLGIHQAKAEAHRKVQAKTQEAHRAYVDGVAKVMGWDAADTKFDTAAHAEDAPAAATKAYRSHLAEMVKRADAAVKLNREQILADASVRAEADLGEVPLESVSPEQLSVQDLDPVRTEALGLGFSTDYGKRAAAAGADKPAIEAEAAEIKGGDRKVTGGAIAKNLELVRDPVRDEKLAPKLVEAKQALDLLKLEKKRKLQEKSARAARKDIDASVTEPKAYVLEVDDAKVDEKVAEDVVNDLRTISTRAFLAEVSKTSDDPAKALGRHIGVGAYNSVNALALAAGGAALVDRSVVDVLGIGGAAEVLARRLATDLSPDDFKNVADGAEEFHLSNYMEASHEAIARARELRDQAAEIELGSAENGHDLAFMQEINRRRGAAIRESQKVLGTALGEMEANAALVYALRRGKSDKPFQVAMGNMPVESAIAQLRALGLQRGDYGLETVAGNRVLTIQPQGMDRLAAPVNKSDLEQVRRNLDIMGGSLDEENWLPAGFSDRPDLDLSVKPGVAAQLAEPFKPGENLESAVSDYIGGRAADGDSPADIVADLQSADFIQKVGFERAGEYRAVLDKLAPLVGDDGKMHQAEALRSSFEAIADKFVSDKYGAERSPLHRQTFTADEHSFDALHRALAAEPTGTAAYKQIGELTPQDQGALRDYFAKHVAKESPGAAGLRAEHERLKANEPERQIEDMFGDTVTNPDWSDWRAKRDDTAGKLNAAGLTWPKYVESMGSPEAAYKATQDVVRSGVSKQFAETYNTLNPAAQGRAGHGKQ
jgi:hypothetical protein